MAKVVQFRSLVQGRDEIEGGTLVEFRSLALAEETVIEWYEERGVAHLSGRPVRLVCDNGSWGVVLSAEWFQGRDEAHARAMFKGLLGRGGVEVASSVRVAS